MQCAQCGTQGAMSNGLCEACFLPGQRLFELKPFPVHYCNKCGRYFSGEREGIERLVLQHLKAQHRLVRKSVRAEVRGNRIMVQVACAGYIKPARRLKEETRELVLTAKTRKCPDCIKALGGYYEALVQLRGSSAGQILQQVKTGSVQETKHGYDIRFVAKSGADKVAKTLSKEFSVVRSFTLVGEKKGKKLYRTCYAVR